MCTANSLLSLRRASVTIKAMSIVTLRSSSNIVIKIEKTLRLSLLIFLLRERTPARLRGGAFV